ncbi:MAG: 3-isopropylmalate dehydratase large subunit, partial [Gemmatimonadales bacterium]
MPRTMLDKIWNAHVVHSEADRPDLMYIDLHLIHEVTSPQAFEGLRLAGRRVRRPELCVATVDHNVPTTDRSLPIVDDLARTQMDTLARNAQEFGITLYDIDSPHQGIVHVMGPEMGFTQPGMTIVCGDSHTSTHGAFGALAFGIGTSQVEHVLATQCLPMARPKSMEIRVNGDLPKGVTAKDLILAIIGQIGVAGGVGYVIEYTGKAVRDLSVEARMTVCNMSIEGGARAGMIAPDDKTVDYLRGRPNAPQGEAFDEAAARWMELGTDAGAAFAETVEIDAASLEPYVTWGTNPGMSVGVTGTIPGPAPDGSADDREAVERALEYMALEPGTPIQEVEIDRVFVGSCTNSRIEDLRVAAGVLAGKHVHERVHAMVVPGSAAVKRMAEEEGLDQIFRDAGFEWREAGCSMCLAMNPDTLKPGERCA